MKDKIKDIYNKINVLIENECFDSDKDFQYWKFQNTLTPIKKRKVLFKLFPAGSPTESNIKILERFIIESNEEASKYNKPELVIGEEYHEKVMVLYYTETEQDVFERLTLEYDNLLKHIKQKKEKEYNEYKRLKAKFEPLTNDFNKYLELLEQKNKK